MELDEVMAAVDRELVRAVRTRYICQSGGVRVDVTGVVEQHPGLFAGGPDWDPELLRLSAEGRSLLADATGGA